jgi:fatty-acyl-CoA synthase
MVSITDFNKNTVAEMLCRRVTYLPDSVVYYFPENQQVYNWRKIYTEVRAIAEGLMRIGVKKGDRIALLIEGRMEVILSMFAAASIGAVTVPINTYSKKEEIKSVLQDARTSVLIMGLSGHHLHYPEMVQEILAEATVTDLSWIPANIFVLGDDDDTYPFHKFSDLQDRKNPMSDDDFVAACAGTLTNDPVLLIYTSGTTGLPKGILRSTASFLVSKEKSPTQSGLVKTYVNKTLDKISNRFKLINLLPLYHLGGISTIFTTLKISNFSVVMLSHFNPVNAIEAINKEKCRFLVGSPYMIQNMMNLLPDGSDMFNTIKGISFASAAVNNVLIEKIISKFKKLAFFTVSYGSSEAGVVANGTCILSGSNDFLISFFLKFFSKVGLLSGVIKLEEFGKTPYSVGGTVDKLVQVKIRDVDTGEFLPVGQHGEIVIKSPRVMRYMKDAETRDSFLSDGWYKSGDMGYLSEQGLLTISGRIKRLISRGGEKISPVEVENVILRNAGVADAFVLGLPDQLYGEQICAAIITKDVNGIDIPLLIEEISSRLSSFKLPKYFVLLPNFPLSSTGKIAVNEIKELALHKISEGDFYA